MLHVFQARRDIPFRKRFFCGYDLHGNTYWEFTVDGNMQRLRRKMEPFEKLIFDADYFGTVPPQWIQWLRRTREHAPTVHELLADQSRQAQIKILAQHAELKWAQEKQRQEQEQNLKLQAELQRVEEEKAKYKLEMENKPESEGTKEDPWAEADAAAEKPNIETATISPRN